MKKIELAASFLADNKNLFQCPICAAPFVELKVNSFCCMSGHSFDLSKKGTLYFLLKAAKNDYGTDMLMSRFQMMQDGLFAPLLDRVHSLIAKEDSEAVLDVGCGEGSQLDYLCKLGLKGQKVGFDISKEAIQLAARHFTSAFWCIADLAKSPFASNQYGTILNLFSPSNYKEFDRLLVPGGQVIKVVPERNYLIELRQLLYRDTIEKQSYSNTAVLEKFEEHFPQMKVQKMHYSFPLPEENFGHLLNMTPLNWGASKDAMEYTLAHPFRTVTIDVCLLIGTKNR